MGIEKHVQGIGVARGGHSLVVALAYAPCVSYGLVWRWHLVVGARRRQTTDSGRCFARCVQPGTRDCFRGVGGRKAANWSGAAPKRGQSFLGSVMLAGPENGSEVCLPGCCTGPVSSVPLADGDARAPGNARCSPWTRLPFPAWPGETTANQAQGPSHSRFTPLQPWAPRWPVATRDASLAFGRQRAK